MNKDSQPKTDRPLAEKLTIVNLRVSIEGKEILKGIYLSVPRGEVHVIMGPNGSGKSTLAQSLMGNPKYKINPPISGGQKSKVKINEKNIIDLNPDERARAGLFLAFQNPIAVPGVSVANLLKTAFESFRDRSLTQKTIANPALQTVWKFNEELAKKADMLNIPHEFLRRSINDGFSGGEKKKLEMLQALVLKPKFAIFDEIDTGLDIDALKIVAEGINILKRNCTGILIITHYQRILKYITPDVVHILINGKIVKTGGPKLAEVLEEKGYAHI